MVNEGVFLECCIRKFVGLDEGEVDMKVEEIEITGTCVYVGRRFV